jgi:AAA15 family ATPase/GTPase
MQEKHLTYFKVENFKRFESFEMNNIGQFNLILGDNNVGKTSVLEALLFDEENIVENYIIHLGTILSEKELLILNSPFINRETEEQENYLTYFIKDFKTDTEIITTFNYKEQTKIQLNVIVDTEINLYEKYSDKYVTVFKEKNLNNISDRLFVLAKINDKVRIKRLRQPMSRIIMPYVPFGKSNNRIMTKLYSTYIQDNKKQFVDALRLFIPLIEDLEIQLKGRLAIIGIREKNRLGLMPLSLYGDGAIRLVQILLHIPACKGKRLMIDEIDAGIHFKKFKDFWCNILLAAKQNEVQIFATTHNEECLEAFKEVLEETEMLDFQKDARSFTLMELPTKQVKAYTYTYEEFADTINSGINVRGGNYQNE